MYWIGGVVFFFLLASCQFVSHQTHFSTAQRPALRQKLFQRGETLYQKQCAVCHGIAGAADGQAAYLVFPKPRDFTRDKFRLVSTNNMEATDEDLFKTISLGMSGSAMPSWEHLHPTDRWALVYYVRYLSEIDDYQKAGELTEQMLHQGPPWPLKEKMINKEIDPRTIIQIPPEPPVTPDGLKRGQELFVASCAGCHGAKGKGDGQQEMKDNLGYPLRPRDLTAGIFKGTATSKDLYHRMLGGIPGTPMPSYAGVFKEEQIWDLIHFVQSLVPSGTEERIRLRRHKIIVQKIKSEIPLDPLSGQWAEMQPIFISLTPLWWRDERIEGLEVRAIYNTDTIAFHLSWADATEDKTTTAIQSFSDGAALQFSMEQDPPFFGMGSLRNPVFIWHWKAAWQKEDTGELSDIENQYPHTAVDWYSAQKDYVPGDAFGVQNSKTKFHDSRFMTGWAAGNPLSDPVNKTAAEEAMSEGLGSYTTQRPLVEKAQAQGTWKDGRWHVVFKRFLKSSEKEALQFSPGHLLNIAFAVWDGSGRDRNGQKMVSIWNELNLRGTTGLFKQ